MIRTDHAALAVSNLERSQSFYQLLGAKTLSRPSNRFIEMELGNLRLHIVRAREGLTPEMGPVDCPRIDHLCLRVDTMDELLSLKERAEGHPASKRWAPFSIIESPPLGDNGEGVEQVQPTKTMYLKDPDGISIEIRYY